MFNDNLGVLGTVNQQDGSVRDVMIIGQGDGSPQSGANILVAIGVLMAATNPDLTPDERGDVLKKIGIMGGDKDFSDIDESTIVNGVKYYFMGPNRYYVLCWRS